MKLGVVIEATDSSLRAVLSQAARIGAAGVQLEAAGELSPDRLTQTGRRDIRTLLRSLGLELTALLCPLRRGLDVAADLQPRIERVKKVMSLGEDLGSRITVVDLPPIPPESERPTTPMQVSAGGIILGAAPVQDPAATLRESLRDLAAYGDRIGVTLALNAGSDSPEKLVEYLNRFDTGALQVNYDPANFLSHGHDPLQALAKLAGRIVHVHAREVRRNAAGQPVEVPLGAGDIDWMTLMAVLDSTGYRGWVVVKRTESHQRLTDLQNGLDLLRRFLRHP
ncbi:MAG: sugar phosphate isomerase/epimerase [Gemmataceae bacterium]|nr:sugar phosphate isomerase/epimerase [Gemmataceae bacterium]